MDTNKVKVGNRVSVVCDGIRSEGTLRYIGKTRLGAGQWFGVEVAKRKGNSDGSVDGVRYFHCAPSAGVFVRESAISLVSPIPATTPTRRVQQNPIKSPRSLSPAAPSNSKSFSRNKSKHANGNLSTQTDQTSVEIQLDMSLVQQLHVTQIPAANLP
ncbi:Dynactin subunit 1 [Physocladia obscura]|uniref:Dynactin subunit 1 n=1 Tax=Physocladia obscura TaxID=109957 RepID=A0AAD5SP59_9FUNG|nr:Dynactin subunit 1 [Physocladia obscura]